MHLIGFAGRAGCGKSTAAKALVAQAGFERISFADPLRDMLRALGLDDAELLGAMKEQPSGKLGGCTPRRALQTLGTEWGRDMICPTLWIDAWGRRADAAIGVDRAVVADDVRFPNEIAALHARGGRVFWIERGPVRPPAHASEALDPALCDGVIVNPGDEGFFLAVARAILEPEHAV